MRADASPPGRRSLWLAFAWGLAEATCFFIVPDVLTSRLVLQRTRTGLAACFCALAGALIGGASLYFLGREPATQTSLLAAMDHLPGINAELIDRARTGLGQGLTALFAGVLAGIPYKLYATQAAGLGIGAGAFLTASIAARLARFLLVTGLAWFVGVKLLPNLGTGIKLRIHAGAWILFYLAYFWRMGV